MKKIIIAIDGFSSCGKSTMAKDLAREIGYIYIDSGAMYRAVTLYCLEHGLFQGDTIDTERLKAELPDLDIAFKLNHETGRPQTYLDGKLVENDIRTLAVSSKVSIVAALDFVREARFGRLGAFTYSEEEGTYGAEHYKDTVSSKEKQHRLDELMTLQSEISLDFNRSRVGDEVKVIVDGFSDGVYVCRSEFESPEVDGEILIKYDSQAVGGAEPYSLVGEFLEVRITGADEYDLIGEIIRVL